LPNLSDYNYSRLNLWTKPVWLSPDTYVFWKLKSLIKELSRNKSEIQNFIFSKFFHLFGWHYQTHAHNLNKTLKKGKVIYRILIFIQVTKHFLLWFFKDPLIIPEKITTKYFECPNIFQLHYWRSYHIAEYYVLIVWYNCSSKWNKPMVIENLNEAASQLWKFNCAWPRSSKSYHPI